jgi:hypothetical protein
VKKALILAGMAAIALAAAFPAPAAAYDRCDRYDRYSRYDRYDRYDRGHYRDRDRYSIGLSVRSGDFGGSFRYDSGRRYRDHGYGGYSRDRYYSRGGGYCR